MDDDLVGRGADGGRESAVPEKVRLGPVLGEHLARDLVQILRRCTGHGRLTGGRVDGGNDQARLTHLGDLRGGLDFHHDGLRLLPLVHGAPGYAGDWHPSNGEWRVTPSTTKPRSVQAHQLIARTGRSFGLSQSYRSV